MISGNLPALAVLLTPLILWGSEGPQAAAAPETGKASQKPAPTQSLQAILLRRLGLQRRPRPKPGLPVPQYLLDLYQLHLGKAPSSFPDSERPFLEERAMAANTVRAFHHVGALPSARLLQKLVSCTAGEGWGGVPRCWETPVAERSGAAEPRGVGGQQGRCRRLSPGRGAESRACGLSASAGGPQRGAHQVSLEGGPGQAGKRLGASSCCNPKG